ncbi:MAG: zinc ABC transporter substrate-binding protein, partial [Miltoncostaeaceae bacterium]
MTTTVNFIRDLAEVVGGERVEVTGLLGPGVDPHLYKASAGDVSALREADIVLYGGLELEGRMGDLLAELESTRPTVAVTRDIPEDALRRPTEFEGKFDPHVWFSVPLWKSAVTTTAEAFAELDPAHADDYRARADAYLAELDELDAFVREQVATVAPAQRVLVTSHDAFGYFGREYGFEVAAIQGTSTATEATTSDIERVAGGHQDPLRRRNGGHLLAHE